MEISSWVLYLLPFTAEPVSWKMASRTVLLGIVPV